MNGPYIVFDDWSTYQVFAFRIAVWGEVLSGGGEGLFNFQPFYRYVVAFFHWLLRTYAKTEVTMKFYAIFRSRSTYFQLCTTFRAQFVSAKMFCDANFCPRKYFDANFRLRKYFDASSNRHKSS